MCLLYQSSWFRDALSELDPSYDKLTFISNPPDAVDEATTGRQRRRNGTKPILRIKAGGNFGSTEVCCLVKYDEAYKHFPRRWIIPMTEMSSKRLNVLAALALGAYHHSPYCLCYTS